MSPAESLDQKILILDLNIMEVVNKHASGVLIVGPPGGGKSYRVGKSVKDVDCAYAPTQSTPLAFYRFIYLNRSELIIVDDSADGFRDSKIQAMTKALVWPHPVTQKFTVSWNSTSNVLERDALPQEFDFEGRIIFIANTTPANIHAQAIRSRLNVVHYDLSIEEKKVLMRQIIDGKNRLDLRPEQGQELLEFIFRRVNPATKNFDLRLLEKAAIHYNAYPNQWKILVGNMLDSDPRYETLERLFGTQLSVEDQAKEFERETGFKRRTFFDLRQQWGLTGKQTALLHNA